MDSNTTHLPALNLPDSPLKRRRLPDGAMQVYDPLRLKWVILTPEEHVRQRFVAYLTHSLGYPAGMMANEVSLRLNGTLRRCDTVLFDRMRQPLAIIEYKAPSIPITQAVFEQIVRYNMVLRASFLMVSNGLKHYCCRVDYSPPKVTFLKEIPSYEAVTGFRQDKATPLDRD